MIDINGKKYKELRCSKCQKFIVYQSVSAGILLYACPRCGYVNEFTFKYLRTKGNQDTIEKDYSIRS